MATVLLAEDDDGLRELIEFVLTGAGHAVLPCGDGVTALALARAAPPDLAVLDVSMPGRDGLEVCAVLRAETPTARTPVLLLTAHSLPDDVTAGFGAGTTESLLKPFSAQDLLTRVETVLPPGGWDRLTGRPGQSSVPSSAPPSEQSSALPSGQSSAQPSVRPLGQPSVQPSVRN